MIALFADCPHTMEMFALRWRIDHPYTRAVVVICSRCRSTMPMALVSDVIVSDDKDAKVMLILELEIRGWKLDGGKPICPRC